MYASAVPAPAQSLPLQSPVYVPMHSSAPAPSPSVTNNFYPSYNHEGRGWAAPGPAPPAQMPVPMVAAPVAMATPAASTASWPYFWPVFAVVVALAFFILYVVHVVSGRKTQRLLKKAMRQGPFWHSPPTVMRDPAFVGSSPSGFNRYDYPGR